jgi:starvation-inducible DNA-binding protein
MKAATLLNAIGLESGQSAVLAEKMNILLSDYQVLYMNVRGFHWNIKGQAFFELHAKFEELYLDLAEKADAVAERILTTGHTPLHSYSQYLKVAEIEEVVDVTEGKACVLNILDGLKKILLLQREILEDAGKTGDEGTIALMGENITAQEKLVWMYSAYIGI